MPSLGAFRSGFLMFAVFASGVAYALCPGPGLGPIPEDAGMSTDSPLSNLHPLMGRWEGDISGADAAGNAFSIPIRWTSHPAFDGRYLRFEFTGTEPRANGTYVEYEGLFTWDEASEQIETIWMSPGLRKPGETHYLDGPMIFFETGTFDESGKVLTLTSQQKRTREAESKPVRSTFRLIDDDHFTIVDEQRDEETGEWKAFGTFTLRRAAE